jgi:hypothetical protein
MTCPPRVATRRRPERPNDTRAIAAVVAYALRKRLTPAQRLILDVATERLPSGRYAYPIVIVSTPRQVGKTTLELGLGVHRTLRGERVAYTADSGQKARRKWREQMESLPPRLTPRGSIRWSNGDERWAPRTLAPGGVFWPFPPNRDATHGEQIDTAILDELWSLAVDEGDALLTAVKPAQQTRPRPQTWEVSTEGDPRSIWWAGQVDAARAHALADTGQGVAFFEWAAPDEDSVFDPETWPSWHPGAGVLFPVETIPDLLAGMPRDEALRSFGNLRRASIVSAWPAGAWEAGTLEVAPDPMPPPAALCLDVAPGRESASIAAAHVLEDGRVLTQLLVTGQGTGWVAEVLADLDARWGLPVDYDAVSQAAPIVDELTPRLRGVRFRPVDTRGYVAACGGHLDAVIGGRAVHLSSPELDAAAAGAVRRVMGDRFGWSRSRSPVDATPLLAAAIAWRAVALESAAPRVFVRGSS